MQKGDLKNIVRRQVASLNIRRGDNVWVEHQGLTTYPVMDIVLDEVKSRQGLAHISNHGDLYLNDMLPRASKDDLARMIEKSSQKMREMQCSVVLRDPDYDSKITAPELMKAWRAAWAPIEDWRLNNTRHVTIVTPPAPPLAMPGKLAGHFPPPRSFQ